jgi:hypothetical protein
MRETADAIRARLFRGLEQRARIRHFRFEFERERNVIRQEGNLRRDGAKTVGFVFALDERRDPRIGALRGIRRRDRAGNLEIDIGL